MTFVFRIAAVLIALSWPMDVAAAPSGVSGIFAEVREGHVTVHWNAPQEGEDISYYRVYHSQKSILENGGTYDDFETTDGRLLEHTLRDAPSTGTLYVSVLAVDSNGEESPFFLEETKVELGAGVTPPPEALPTTDVLEPVAAPVETETLPQEVTPDVPVENVTGSVIPPQSQAVADSAFALLSTQAISATGVTFTFSLPISVIPERALEAVVIADAAGTLLPLTRLIIEGASLTVHTEMQERGKAYIAQIGTAVQGTPANGGTPLTLDIQASRALFSGHPTGLPPKALVQQMLPPPSDVSGLRIRGRATGSRYTVAAAWQGTTPLERVAYYEVRQSLDAGETFSEPEQVPGDVLGVEFRSVEPGTFGISVRTVATDGQTSRGVFSLVDLPPVKRNATELPGSGAGAVVALLLTAGMVGWRRMRKV